MAKIPSDWYDAHAVQLENGYWWPMFNREGHWYRYRNNERTPYSLPGYYEHYASEEQAKANLLAHFNEYGEYPQEH